MLTSTRVIVNFACKVREHHRRRAAVERSRACRGPRQMLLRAGGSKTSRNRNEETLQALITRRRGFWCIAIVVALFGSLGTLQAQESGQVPYATIHKVVSRAQQVKHPQLRAIVTLESKTGAAKKDMTMVVQAKSGDINVPIGDDGEIRNFPMTPELLKENPPVRSNQPKGSSQLQVALAAVLPDSPTYSYRELAQLLDRRKCRAEEASRHALDGHAAGQRRSRFNSAPAASRRSRSNARSRRC
jgi:hypothetical protein